MDQVVADASVIIKLFVKEEYTDAALNLINSYVSGSLTIAVPSLLIYEVLSGIRYSKSKKFTLDEIKVITNTIEEYDFNIIQPDQEVLQEIMRVSIKYNISLYDSVYVAIASLKNAVLYTADQKLMDVVRLPFVKHIRAFKME
jgi:predicted nucleic acid-binding protein